MIALLHPKNAKLKRTTAAKRRSATEIWELRLDPYACGRWLRVIRKARSVSDLSVLALDLSRTGTRFSVTCSTVARSFVRAVLSQSERRWAQYCLKMIENYGDRAWKRPWDGKMWSRKNESKSMAQSTRDWHYWTTSDAPSVPFQYFPLFRLLLLNFSPR